MKNNYYVFIIRWLVNSVGLWLSFLLLGSGSDNIHVTAGVLGFLLAGFIFSIINGILKPLVIIVSLPAIVLTLGLFMVVVNGLMVYLSVKLAPGISMTFLNSIITGIILSLLNYIVSAALINRSKSTN
jgi:putative membrane protein